MNHKTLIISFCLCIILSFKTYPQVNIDYDENFKDVFFDVTLSSVYGDVNIRIKKWEQNIKIFIKNPEQDILVEEFEKIKDEINELSSSISLERVYDESQANFVIFFSDQEEYSNYETKIKKRELENNWAYYWITWNANEIFKASLYVDVVRTKDIDCQKHLLREVLTQALGLMNYCDKYEDSIFYNKWTCTTSYSEIDKDLIRLFLSPQIKANMNMAQICKSLQWEFKIHAKRKVIARTQLQDITILEYNDGFIQKKEILHEEDYSWSSSQCILYLVSEYENKKWEKRIVLAAQRYGDEKTQKLTWADPAIILCEGEPEELLLYLNQCEEVLMLQPVFEDQYIMKNHQVYVNKILGTPQINIYFSGKGWVTIGAKAIKRIKNPFLRWAKKQGIHFEENQ